MDNKVAHDIAEAKGLTCKVKHLEVRDAYIRILRERGIVKIVKVASSQNRSDVMTKAFGSPGDFIHMENMLLGLSSESVGECCGETSSHIRDVQRHPNMDHTSMDIHTLTERGINH